MPPSSPPPEGFSDSDQQWFDRLSGKPGPYDDVPAVREADALRLALDQEQQRLAGDSADAIDEETLARDWERLQFALKHEGLLQRARYAGWNRWSWPALGGIAAALLLSAVLVPLWRDLDRAAYPEPPVLRGAGGVHQVVVADPRGAAEQFAAALRQAGLAPGVYHQGDTFVVDILLLPEQLVAATPAFQSLGLMPASLLNRIAFNRP